MHATNRKLAIVINYSPIEQQWIFENFVEKSHFRQLILIQLQGRFWEHLTISSKVFHVFLQSEKNKTKQINKQGISKPNSVWRGGSFTHNFLRMKNDDKPLPFDWTALEAWK